MADNHSLKNTAIEKADTFLRVESKILVVEDNETNSLILEALFSTFGLKASYVSNGREALEALDKEKFDIVFMDIQMPEMDGEETTKLIRKNFKYKDCPIIALTANTLVGDREKYLSLGMNDVLEKPITNKALELVLRKWLKVIPQNSQNVFAYEDYLRRVQGDKKIALRIIESYLRNLPDLIKEFYQGFETGDVKKIQIAAHTLKGTSANMSLKELSALALEFEKLAKENRLCEIIQRRNELDEKINHARTDLELWMKNEQ